MAVTGTKTVREIVTDAMRLGRVIDVRNPPEAHEIAIGRSVLNDMLKEWQNAGLHVWAKTSGTLTLTSAHVYTLSPVRPLEILNARYWNGSSELHMIALQREDYDRLPNKTATGVPTQFYYDRQREAATFTVWPAPAASVVGNEIRYTYQREFEDIGALTDTVDVPAEFYMAVQYNLACHICDALAKDPPPRVVDTAKNLRDQAEAYDHEGVVNFTDGRGYFHPYR